MTHTHQFIKLEDVTKNRTPSVSFHGGLAGALCACPLCGEVRKVWADGVVEIVVEGHEHTSE